MLAAYFFKLFSGAREIFIVFLCML